MNDTEKESYYREGWNSYWSGLNKTECPYAIYTSKYSEWNDGYYEALICDVGHQPRGMGGAYEQCY